MSDVYAAKYSYRDYIPEEKQLEAYKICKCAELGTITPFDAIARIQSLASREQIQNIIGKEVSENV